MAFLTQMELPYVTITLRGSPRGKGRPRFRVVKPRGRPQFVTTYTDADTVEYEARLAIVGRLAMRGLAVLDEPLAVGIEALMPIPESWSKAKRALAIEGDLLPASGIDNDNIIKIAQDSLNKIVWHDEALIVPL